MKKIVFALTMVSLLFVASGHRAAAGDNTLWTDNGVPISTVVNQQKDQEIVSDGSGGVVIAWEDNRSGSYDIYVQRVDANGDTLWTLDGVPICTAANSQYDPELVGDGTGGAIIAWRDYRGGTSDIYAQRVNLNGAVKWIPDGVPISTAVNTQTTPELVSDGSGGAIIAWEDRRTGTYDIYAQRVDGYGDTLWTLDGVPICTAVNNQYYPELVSDGSGGVIITWADYRSGSNWDIYAQRVDANGDTLWRADGVAISTATDHQDIPQLVSDGTGGAIITWEDWRGADKDIYAQRVDGDGYTLWPPNGVAICTDTLEQEYPQIVADGSGGAIITWHDFRDAAATDNDIYAQRVDAYGNALWTLDGEPICTAWDDDSDPQLAGDGHGGAIIAWEDRRSGWFHIYAQYIDANGNVHWAHNGEAICTAIGNQNTPQLASDGFGGAIIAWEDGRTDLSDIYAQRVLGPAPRITSIADVPDDQGREVEILWDRSYLDDLEYQEITYYSIWRKHMDGSKLALIGEEWDGLRPKDLTQLLYRRIERADGSGGTKTEYWEYIGSVDAHYLEGYSFIAPTLEDSSASGPAYFSFFVSAHTADPFIFWDSQPDSGYSVDNISPAKTQVGVMAFGVSKGAVNTVWLCWDQVTVGVDGSPEKGTIQYRIYYAEDPGFAPGPGNLLTTTSDLDYSHTDSRIGDPSANLFYLVTVIDGSDNESAMSNVVGEFDKDVSN